MAIKISSKSFNVSLISHLGPSWLLSWPCSFPLHVQITSIPWLSIRALAQFLSVVFYTLSFDPCCPLRTTLDGISYLAFHLCHPAHGFDHCILISREQCLFYSPFATQYKVPKALCRLNWTCILSQAHPGPLMRLVQLKWMTLAYSEVLWGCLCLREEQEARLYQKGFAWTNALSHLMRSHDEPHIRGANRLPILYAYGALFC